MKSLYFLVIFCPLSMNAVFTEYSQLKLGDSALHLYGDVHNGGEAQDNCITDEQIKAEKEQLNGLKEIVKGYNGTPMHFLVEEPVKEVVHAGYQPLLRCIRPTVQSNNNITGENGECRLYTLAYHAKHIAAGEYELPYTRTLQTKDGERVASIVTVTKEDVQKEVKELVDAAKVLAHASEKPYKGMLETQISRAQNDARSFPENSGLIASLLDLHLLKRTIELIQEGNDVAICAGQTHTSNIRGLLRQYNFPSIKQITGNPYLTAEDMKASISNPEDLACNSFCTIS